MQDLPLIIGRLIGIVVLTLHDYLRYRVNRLPRRQPRRVPLRRLPRAPGWARYAARRQRTLPYTGETQRLHRVGDLGTLSAAELWSAVLQRYEGDKQAAAQFLAEALTHGSNG